MGEIVNQFSEGRCWEEAQNETKRLTFSIVSQNLAGLEFDST